MSKKILSISLPNAPPDRALIQLRVDGVEDGDLESINVLRATLLFASADVVGAHRDTSIVPNLTMN